jgi:SPP1 family predicted phage head-tail adaptor
VIRAGLLRHRVTIQADQGTTRNSVGEHIEDWQTWGEAWASIEPLSGKEIDDARQVAARATTRVTIRYRDGVHAGMRLVHDGEVLHVEAVLNERMADHWLVLLCMEAP